MNAFPTAFRGDSFPSCHAPAGGAHTAKVAVVAHGEISVESLLCCLRLDPAIRLVGGSARADADIVLVLASVADDELLELLSLISGQATNPVQRIVLVSEPLSERRIATAFSSGVVSILPHREATDRLIVQAVVSSARGHAVLPSALTRWLVDEARMLQQTMFAARGIELGGLTEREVTVLRLLADGYDTASIAERLSYSGRTIKKILQDIMRRFGFRNRVQAVAYAMRIGAI